MRKILLFGFLFANFYTFGQTFTLEHHYGHAMVRRIDFENSGEKYMLANRATDQVEIYNPDHTLWKSISVPVPDGYHLHYVWHISETKINPDDNIEIVYQYVNDEFTFLSQSMVISEDGTVLVPAQTQSFRLSEIDGLAPKLFGETSVQLKIYSLPGVVLEHTVPLATRVKLEVSGEKYYRVNSISGALDLFNPDMTIWKSIPLPAPVGSTDISVGIVSEQEINTDVVLEVSYTYLNSGVHTAKLINENGTELLSVDNAGKMWIDKVDGLEDKLFMTRHTTDAVFTEVYTLPGLTPEHQYDATLVRIKLESDGEKYYTSDINHYYPETNSIALYNANHTPWKTIQLPVPSMEYYVIHIESITQTVFAEDDLLEINYTNLSDFLLDTFVFDSRIINELGTVYLTSPSSWLYLDTTGDAPKLIGMTDATTGWMWQYDGYVYGFDNTMATEEFNRTATVLYPNPASQDIFIRSENRSIVKADVYSVSGSLVRAFEGNGLERLDMGTISAGLYLLRLTDADGKQTGHKISVAR